MIGSKSSLDRLEGVRISLLGPRKMHYSPLKISSKQFQSKLKIKQKKLKIALKEF